MKIYFYYCIALLTITACSDNNLQKKKDAFSDGAQTLFTKIQSEFSGISFSNNVSDSYEYNFLSYPSMYSGAGIAVGDFDKDGFEDVYFVSNFGQNKLYKNNGGLSFTDITEASGTGDDKGFSTGTTILDVNNDGWPDIYVCKAGSLKDDEARRNLLFVNQKNGSFKEEAARWGLDDPGYTTQAYPLDFDMDGDLDLYVVNYRYDFKNNTRISSEIQKQIEEVTSDQLYRNDGDHFTKVTAQAGLYNKAWGLAAAIGDFNNDGWADIYVSNDYLEPDFLYINQQDGTFKNEIDNRIKHISFYSMGSDYADLNNDLYPDLVTLDMAAENYARSKENMASMSTENFMQMVAVGYHHAYMANMLHYSTGRGKYRETGQMSGIVKTDWSWAPLIADYDNDGLKDLFISNGILYDYTNQDFRTTMQRKSAAGETMTLESVIALLPSQKLSNYAYKNNGDLTFTKSIEAWGLDDPTFSNGAVYADFDNDGDLDILVSNINDMAGLYRNNSNNNYIQFQLQGPELNPLALGAEIILETSEGFQCQQLYVTRGYESSVSNVIHFGLGEESEVGKAIVKWPDGKQSVLKDVEGNQRISVRYEAAKDEWVAQKFNTSVVAYINASELGIDYRHSENEFNDYDRQLLLPQKQSTKGTGIVISDVNGDQLEDFFVGNAAGAPAALYVQKSNGQFQRTNEKLWQEEAGYEDSNALFFDADNDGDQDLYVVSSGYDLAPTDILLQDRLYLNDGEGNFSKNSAALPKMLTSGKSIAAADFDNDGDLDLFIGGNVVPGKYPVAPRSYLLVNNSGIFKDMLSNDSSMAYIGMVSDAIFTDYDSDNDPDLLLVGEWMAPTFFENIGGTFKIASGLEGLDHSEGWWFSVSASDLDNDGDDDYILGNIGTNNKFKPKKEKPIFIYAKDFDENGTFDVALSKINDGKVVPVRGKECSSQQNPFLLEKIGTYKEFASMEMKDIYGEEELNEALKLTAYMFESTVLMNLGNGKFEIIKLPNDAQTGPTLATITDDFNGDGAMDILGVGAIYDAEVETIRYDANYGYVLLGDGKGGFINSRKHEPFVDLDTKDMAKINILGKDYFVLVSNNAPLTFFTFDPEKKADTAQL